MNEKQKQWIDKASLEQLLSRWRFASVGDSIFQGDTGAYYQKIMNEKRAANPDQYVAASKRIGW